MHNEKKSLRTYIYFHARSGVLARNISSLAPLRRESVLDLHLIITFHQGWANGGVLKVSPPFRFIYPSLEIDDRQPADDDKPVADP